MTIIEIEVDENILREAEKALNIIGMDVQIAVNIFLRRVAIEKGFPIPMTAPVTSQRENVDIQEEGEKEPMYQIRYNNTITAKMVDEVWLAFLRCHKGYDTISNLKYAIADNSGMNSGSAFIYLNILTKLIKGEPNTRTLKMKDLEYFMGKIKSELGLKEYQNAKESLKTSIPYWREKLAGSFAEDVEKNLNGIWKN